MSSRIFKKRVDKEINGIMFIIILLLGCIGFLNYKYILDNLDLEAHEILASYNQLEEENIINKFDFIGSDLKYIRALPSLNDYIENSSLKNRIELEEDLSNLLTDRIITVDQNLLRDLDRFLQSREAMYFQVKYISGDGLEEVKVSYVNNTLIVANQSQLINEYDKYYFRDTMNLEENSVYMSRVDLSLKNVEFLNDKSENIPSYVSVIRFATPVFNDEGERRGVVLISAYSNYIFESFQTLHSHRDVGMSVSHSHGIYINNQNYLDNSEQLFGEYLHHNHNLPGEMEFNGHIVAFHKMDLAGIYLRNNPGIKLVPKENDWILIAISPKNSLLNILPVIRFNLIVLFIFLLIVFYFLKAYLKSHVSIPLNDLVVNLKKVESGDYSTRFDIDSNDEVEEIAYYFNKMVRRLEVVDIGRKQLDRAKTEFLSITSHELRSPMTPMKAQLQMLKQGYLGKLNREQKESIKIVLNNTTRLDSIIADFLEISRIEAARLKFVFEKTNLKPHIESVVKEMRSFMPKKRIKLKLLVEPLPDVETDADRIMQVLRNLINNAIKFSEKDSIVQINAKKIENFIQVSVADNGIGIEPEKLERIFEPFFQGEETMYRKYGGNGLGLTICKGIIEAQGGKIWAESKVGVGTTFYFTVPLVKVKNLKPIKLMFSQEFEFNEKKRKDKQKEVDFEKKIYDLLN